MTKKKKINLPKLTKKLQWFLTDESGKITKKDALWVGLWASLIWLVDNVDAAWGWSGHSSYSHSNNAYCSLEWHSSWFTWQHINGTRQWHWSGPAGSHTNSASTTLDWSSEASGHSSHGSTAHGSHGSHWSHGSHGSRW